MAVAEESIISFAGIKCANLVFSSTTTKIESDPLLFGILTMKLAVTPSMVPLPLEWVAITHVEHDEWVSNVGTSHSHQHTGACIFEMWANRKF